MQGKTQGYKSTEFWLSLAAIIVGVLMESGAMGDGALKGLGMASSLLAALGYTFNRSSVKKSIAKAEAVGAVAEAAAIGALPDDPS